MSFDPRSLERLRQLGRSLPQRLPAPEPPPAVTPSATPSAAEGKRHRLETEMDPEALFHELMRTSADGSAPPHLLERLRELEARRSRPETPQPGAAATAGRSTAAEQAAGRGAGRTRRRGPGARGAGQPQRGREQADLYTAFEQLLLEDDEI
ncbi:hypothetical protein [Cyanobium sp. CH-040]|uniref:hypothetical protein n=1 Tax=Cyanobium sp. CH-040 TaxID=2823708 RepID=UPI0020CF8E11|nr:hypothetical protein [Cyanobium sp. CH-040]MCP9926875.1 hypothetical protein [Cyanobium sp. CH-040]